MSSREEGSNDLNDSNLSTPEPLVPFTGRNLTNLSDLSDDMNEPNQESPNHTELSNLSDANTSVPESLVPPTSISMSEPRILVSNKSTEVRSSSRLSDEKDVLLSKAHLPANKICFARKRLGVKSVYGKEQWECVSVHGEKRTNNEVVYLPSYCLSFSEPSEDLMYCIECTDDVDHSPDQGCVHSSPVHDPPQLSLIRPRSSSEPIKGSSQDIPEVEELNRINLQTQNSEPATEPRPLQETKPKVINDSTTVRDLKTKDASPATKNNFIRSYFTLLVIALIAFSVFLCLVSGIKFASTAPVSKGPLDESLPVQQEHVQVKAYELSSSMYARTVVEVSSSTRDLVWEAYGIKMHFPRGFLPSYRQNVSISIKVMGSSDQFQFPVNHSLVSAVYWIECFPVCNFQKNISVAIQHYGVYKSNNLAFVRTGHDDFVFDKLDGGRFSNTTSYGVIDISHFCGVGIGQEEPGEKRYFAGLMYRPVVDDAYSLHFVMSVMLNAVLNHVYQSYSDWLLGSSDVCEFESEKISLSVDKNGVDTNGWTILPYNSIIIDKRQVERHHNSSGGRVPHCRLELFWNGGEERKRLVHRIELIGADQDHNFVTLDSNDFESGTRVSTLLTNNNQAYYLTQYSEDIAAIRTPRPEDHELQLIRWKDPSTGAEREFRLKEELVGSWRKIGTTFGIKDVALDVMCTDPEKCCNEVLLKWRQGNIPRRKDFPVQWGGLIDAVHENFPQVADDLENALINQL